MDEAMNIEGVVNKECFIKPVMNAKYLQYKKLIRNAVDNIEEKTKFIDYFEDIKKTAKFSRIKEIDLLAKKIKQFLQDKKRERLEKGDVMEIIFNAFENMKNGL